MIQFITTKPSDLLKSFDNAIDNKSIRTWSRTSVEFYTHIADNWGHKALFNATVLDGKLEMRLIRVEANCTVANAPAVFSYYHGHLVETFMNHFRESYSGAIVTSKPAPPKDSGF